MSDPQNGRPTHPAPAENAGTGVVPSVQPALADDPAEIRAEMSQTRAELGETLNAIQERLTPDYVKQEVTDNVREATIGKVAGVKNRIDDAAHEAMSNLQEAQSSLFYTIRRDPFPAALIGVALAALIVGALTAGRPRLSRFSFSFLR